MIVSVDTVPGTSLLTPHVTKHNQQPAREVSFDFNHLEWPDASVTASGVNGEMYANRKLGLQKAGF